MVIDTRRLISTEWFVDFSVEQKKMIIWSWKSTVEKIVRKIRKQFAAYWCERHRSRSKHLSTFVISHFYFANFVGGSVVVVVNGTQSNFKFKFHAETNAHFLFVVFMRLVISFNSHVPKIKYIMCMYSVYSVYLTYTPNPKFTWNNFHYFLVRSCVSFIWCRWLFRTFAEWIYN